MNLILIFGLGLLGVFLAIVMVLFLVIARNLKSMAAAVEQATNLVQTVESQGGIPITPPPRKRTMKEIFSVLPSLLKRADTLDKR
ncbi:MAG TPA: hypothetical protein VET24_09670 [Actinomycetota bacterium]|nr:hypothetical protein [Actinomycetota bacterium]